MAELKTVPRPAERESSPRAQRIFLWVFSILLVITAGSAFLMKLIDFYITATREGAAALGSFLVPVMNYLFIAAGFGALFIWAHLRGQFKDVEGPKYRMLEQNLRWEREELESRR